jgi:MFS transporter, PPP family, 3-phenylpropionic acid transporter
VESGEVLVYLTVPEIMPARIFGLRFSIFYAFLTIGNGMQLPFLPLWLHAKGLTVAEIALVFAGMTACRIVAVPLVAIIADRYHNRRILIILCGFVSFLGYMLLATASGFWQILAISFFASVFTAPIATLAEGFSVDGSAVHGLDYGRLRLWASLSFLLGNLGGGALLLYIPITSLIYLIAVAQGVSALVAFLLPPDPERERPRLASEPPANFPRVLKLLVPGVFMVFVLAASLGQASHAMLYTFGPVHWDALGYDKFTIGSFWAISIMAEVTLFGFSSALVRRFGPVMLIMVGISGGVIRWIFMAQDFGLGVTAVLQAFHAISFAMVHLGTMHYIHQTVPAGLRNSAQGLYAAISGGIALSASMWLSGLLYDELLGKTYLVMAAISLVALSFALALKRISPTTLAAADT